MYKFLTIEYIDGTIKEIACDDCREDGASLMYYIRFGQNEDGHGYHCEKFDYTRFPVYADFYCADYEKRGGEND